MKQILLIMESYKSSSTTSLLTNHNTNTPESTSKSVAATNNVHKRQRITVQIPIFIVSSTASTASKSVQSSENIAHHQQLQQLQHMITPSTKSKSVPSAANIAHQQLLKLQRIIQPILSASSKLTSLSNSSAPKSVAASSSKVNQQIPISLPSSMTISLSGSSNIFGSCFAPTPIAANTHKDKPLPGLAYSLYLHRTEVRRRKSPLISIGHTKLQLTQELTTKTIKNIYKCPADDLHILGQVTIFQQNLKKQMVREKFQHLMALYLKRYQKQQPIQLSVPQKRRLIQPHGSSKKFRTMQTSDL